MLKMQNHEGKQRDIVLHFRPKMKILKVGFDKKYSQLQQ